MSADSEIGLAERYLKKIEYEVSTYLANYLHKPHAIVVSGDVAKTICVQTVQGVPVRTFEYALPGTILVGRYARETTT